MAGLAFARRVARPLSLGRATVAAPATYSRGSDGKLALITGANTGIGFEAAKALGQQGYTVILACRDPARGAAAVSRLRAVVPGGAFELKPLALDQLTSVKDFVKAALDEGRDIDVLLNNAGVMACPEMRTQEGYEYQLGVNHLGHFALTLGLLPLLASSERESRIVTVSSSAHLFGNLNFDDLNWTNGYSAWGAYGNSKLANVMFAFELAKHLPFSANVTSNALHPGVVSTELSRYLAPTSSFFASPFVKGLASMFLKTPEQGAATSIHLASSPDLVGVSGKYFEDCKPKTAKSEAYDESLRRRLWDVSCEMTGIDGDVVAAVQKSGQTVLA